MRNFVSICALIFTLTVSAYDHPVAIGQWAIYESNLLSDDDFYFLKINSDFSGVLVRSLGHKPIVREFDSANVVKQNGYFEVVLSPSEKAVFSAWKSKSGSGRLTGQIFMYKASGELFNMLYFPLQLLENDHEFLKYEAIKELSESYR